MLSQELLHSQHAPRQLRRAGELALVQAVQDVAGLAPLPPIAALQGAAYAQAGQRLLQGVSCRIAGCSWMGTKQGECQTEKLTIINKPLVPGCVEQKQWVVKP